MKGTHLSGRLWEDIATQ